MLRSIRIASIPRPIKTTAVHHVSSLAKHKNNQTTHIKYHDATTLINPLSINNPNWKYFCTQTRAFDLEADANEQDPTQTTPEEPTVDLDTPEALNVFPTIVASLAQARDMTYDKDLYHFSRVLNNSALKNTDPDPLFANMLPHVPRQKKDYSDLRFLAVQLKFIGAASEFKNRSQTTEESWGYLEFCCKYKREEALMDALTFLTSSRHFTDEVALRFLQLLLKWDERPVLTKLIQEVLIPRFQNPRTRLQPDQLESIMQGLAKVPHPDKDRVMTALYEKLKTPKSYIFILEHVRDVTKNFAKMEIIFKNYFEQQKFAQQEPRVFEIMIESALIIGTTEQVQRYLMELKRAGLKFTGNVLHALLTDALRQNDINLFNKYFESAQSLGIINDQIYAMTLKLLIDGGDFKQAYLVFRKMMLKKMSPPMNLITELANLISRSSPQPVTILQNVYFLCVEADLLLTPEFYSALLVGFSQKMQADECIDIYHELLAWELKPTNEITTSMLNVLCPFAWRSPMYLHFLCQVVEQHLKTPELDPKILEPAFGVLTYHERWQELLRIKAMWQPKHPMDFEPFLQALWLCYESLKMDAELERVKKMFPQGYHKLWSPTSVQTKQVEEYMWYTQELERRDRAVAQKPDTDDYFQHWVLDKIDQSEQQMEEQLLI